MAAEVSASRDETRQATRDGVLLVAAGGLAGILNLLFNVVVARGGGVSAYGAIGPLLMLGTVAGVVATGLQYGVARVAAPTPGPTPQLVRMAFRAVLPWVLPTGILAGLAWPIAGFLHLSSPLPVLIVSLLAAVSVAGAAVAGLLIGLRRFRVIAALGVGFAVLRLGLGFLVGHGDSAVDRSVLVSLIPVLGSLLFGLAILLHSRRPSGPSGVAVRPFKRDGIQLTGLVEALTAGGLWTIWGMPLLFSRHALNSVAAGDFAASQLLAGGIIWVTAPLVTAFYPTIVRHRHRSPILVGALGTLGVALVGLLILTAAGPLLIGKLYGGYFGGSRGLFLVLAVSATATACGTFACWAALALRQAMRLMLAFVAFAIVLELGWDSLIAHTGPVLAAGPVVALTLSGGVVTAGALLCRRQAQTSAPEVAETPVVGILSTSARIEQ